MFKLSIARRVALVTASLLVAPRSADAQQFCQSLRDVLRSADNDYADIRGKHAEVAKGIFVAKTSGWISTKTPPGFDICAIAEDQFGCLGPDQLDGDDELTGPFAKLSASITDCLNAKAYREHGWRTTQGHRFESTGDSFIVWTNGGHYDRKGQQTHVTLTINKGGSDDLYKLALRIKKY